SRVLDAPAVGVDHGQDNSLMPLEGRDRHRLVLGHQAAIPDDIRDKDSGEPPLDPCIVHRAPSLPARETHAGDATAYGCCRPSFSLQSVSERLWQMSDLSVRESS